MLSSHDNNVSVEEIKKFLATSSAKDSLYLIFLKHYKYFNELKIIHDILKEHYFYNELSDSIKLITSKSKYIKSATEFLQLINSMGYTSTHHSYSINGGVDHHVSQFFSLTTTLFDRHWKEVVTDCPVYLDEINKRLKTISNKHNTSWSDIHNLIADILTKVRDQKLAEENKIQSKYEAQVRLFSANKVTSEDAPKHSESKKLNK